MSAPSLAAEPWLNAAPTRAVMAALEAAGGARCARFVGGCVRAALMRRPVDDVDIATRLTPPQVIAALKAARLKAVPTGVAHGTVTAVADGQPFEITTLRRDVETDGRRAVVAFTDDWSEDAQRRDFRLNAIYADAQGQVFDPTGEGVADALAGRVVFVGDPETRIAEDALRILRFFRFLAWYGQGAPDAAALAACASLTDRLAQLSAERVSKELLKLLAAADPRGAVRLMDEVGVLGEILPETRLSLVRSSPRKREPRFFIAGRGGVRKSLGPRFRGDERMNDADRRARFEHLVEIEISEHLPPDPLLRLAALLPDDPALAVACGERLRLSNAQRDRLVAALTSDAAIRADMTPPQARRAIYRQGADAFHDRAKLAWAAAPPAASPAPWHALLALARDWPRPVFPLTGEDVMAAGVPRGPRVGAVMRALEAAWIDGDFSEDRPALMAQLHLLGA